MRSVVVAVVMVGCVPAYVNYEKTGTRTFQLAAQSGTPEERAKLIDDKSKELCGPEYEVVEEINLADRGRSLREIRCGKDKPRPTSLAITASVDGVTVSVKPDGNVFWELTIANSTQSAATIVWDESSFVVDGESYGRLIRGETRRMDVAKAQPNTPLAAGATLRQLVFAEKTEPAIGTDIALKDAIEHGTMNIVFDINGAKSTFTATLVDGPAIAK